MINFQQCKPQPLEIYQIAADNPPWDIFPMASNTTTGKKEVAERRARELYDRLMALPRVHDSNNKWTRDAGVSTSFFTNLQGLAKPASEPSIGNLRAILKSAGTTVPEFFLHEAEGRLVRSPSRQALEDVLERALAELPNRAEHRPAFLASVVLRALGLPEYQSATLEERDQSQEGGDETMQSVGRSTRQV